MIGFRFRFVLVTKLRNLLPYFTSCLFVYDSCSKIICKTVEIFVTADQKA